MTGFRAIRILPWISGLLLMSCAALRPVDRDLNRHSARVDQHRVAMVNHARSYIGTPYRYGGRTQKGFDCSGLVYRVFQDHDVLIPRSAREQSTQGRKVNTHQARAADLAFFSVRNKVDHVALVTKANQRELWVIHSTTSMGVVHEEVLGSPYWSKRLRQVRDVLN
ncbi:MAG: C40 family peptidase [Saprospiraceae bacterium]|nr:C40 family peptidase [Saprospiraceae bacterium]